MLALKIFANPVDKVIFEYTLDELIFEYTLDELMEDVRGDQLVNVCMWEMFSEWLETE